MSVSQYFTQPVKTLGIILVLVILFSVLSNYGDPSNKRLSKEQIRKIRNAVQQANQWHTTSKQDSNALLKLLHANNALALLNSTRSFASDGIIEKITHTKVSELQYYLQEAQEQAMKELVTICPSIKPANIYSVGSGWV